MKDSSSSSLEPAKNKTPRWVERRWKLFEVARMRADFKVALASIRAKQGETRLDYYPELLRLVRDFDIPGDCLNALELLVIDQNASDEALKALIVAPIVYYSHGAGERGPSKDTKGNYKGWQSVVAEAIAEGGDLEKSSGELHLVIKPYTTIEEIKEFITENKAEIRRLLDPPNGAAFIPEKLRGNVHSRKKVHEKMRQAYLDEKQPSDIANTLPGSPEASNIRTFLSNERKSGRLKKSR